VLVIRLSPRRKCWPIALRMTSSGVLAYNMKHGLRTVFSMLRILATERLMSRAKQGPNERLREKFGLNDSAR